MPKRSKIKNLIQPKIIKVGLVTVLILFAGVYYRHQRSLNLSTLLATSSTPKPSPTTEYYEYRNDRYGYTFTYPSTVSVNENIGGFGYHEADSQSRNIILLNTKSSAPSQSFYIYAENLPSNESLLSHIKTTNYYKGGILTNSGGDYDIMPNRKILTLEEFTQDGKPGVKLVSQILPGQGSVEDIYYQAYIEYQPGKILIINDGLATYHPLEFDEQIISSFRFFTPAPDPDWIKHTFSDSGFVFSLPADWELTPSDLVNFPEFVLHSGQSFIYGRFGDDGSFGQKARLEDWSVRPDPRASYQLFSDYTKENSYSVLASIQTPNLFIMEAFIPLYNGQNLLLSIDNPTLELMFYRLLNTLTRL